MDKKSTDKSMLESTIASCNEEATLSDIDKSYQQLLFVQNYSTLLFHKKPAGDARSRQLSKEDLLKAAEKTRFDEIEEVHLESLGLIELDLEEGVLEELKNLKTINLAHNSLLNTASLFPFFSLRTLDVSHNCITALGHIDCLVSLEEINLDHNMIESIAPLALCAQLKTVSVQHNHLCQLFEVIRAVKPLTHLEQLSVEGNPFKLSHATYREFLITMLPQVKVLDETCINDIEREVALQIIQGEKGEGSVALPDEKGNDSTGYATKLRELTRRPQTPVFDTEEQSSHREQEIKTLNLQIAQLREEIICKDVENERLKKELKSLKTFDAAAVSNFKCFSKIERCVSAKEPNTCSNSACRQMKKSLQRHLDAALEKLSQREKGGEKPQNLSEDDDIESIVQKSLSKINEVRSLIKDMSGQKNAPKLPEIASWKLKSTKLRAKFSSQKELN